MTEQRFIVLSIEDSEPDFVLIKKAFNAVEGISIDLINIQNGKNALDFLYKRGNHLSSLKPDIIILDINLPDMSGHDILKIIKNDENLKLIPVIMFSTSDSEKDIEESYRLYANSYITKTFEIKDLFEKIIILAEYWLKTAKLPSTSNFCLMHKAIEEKTINDQGGKK